MVKIRNTFGDESSGAVADAGVFASWKGVQYRRKYVIPSNPQTIKQTSIRGSFTNAVDEWHTYLSIQKRVYDYLAKGQALSGFNLLVSRWQKAAIAGLTLPQDPVMGIKQTGSASANQVDEAVPSGVGPHTLAAKPVKIGSLTYSAGTGGVDCHAIVDLNRGKVRITKTVAGQVTIDYKSGGREITGEVLGTGLSSGDVKYTAWWPIDFQSVTLKWATVEKDGLEVSHRDGKIFFTNTGPGDASSKVTYVSYTKLADARLELRKTDTSFVTEREYSDADGFIPIAQTVEDQNYDFILERAGYTTVTRVNQGASAVVADELVVMTAA